MSLTDKILKCLPQTQCKLCEYDGCRPYAEAIAKNEVTIDRCAPGGEETLDALAKVMQISPEPYRQQVISQYKTPSIVSIDTNACIGCTKCIPACPVGAIAGGPKHLHQIIDHLCTGCDLCIPTCPVDCIHPQACEPAPKDKQPYYLEAHDQTLAIFKERLEAKKKRYERKKKMSADLLKRIQS